MPGEYSKFLYDNGNVNRQHRRLYCCRSIVTPQLKMLSHRNRMLGHRNRMLRPQCKMLSHHNGICSRDNKALRCCIETLRLNNRVVRGNRSVVLPPTVNAKRQCHPENRDGKESSLTGSLPAFIVKVRDGDPLCIDFDLLRGSGWVRFLI